MTRDEAIKLYESKWWLSKTAMEIAEFQLNEELLCMPWEVFHEAVSEAIGRDVWTHEFVDPERLMSQIEAKTNAFA